MTGGVNLGKQFMASQDTASLESKQHESDMVSDAKEAPESKTRGAWGGS